MDITTSCTEAFHVYNRFHNSLNMTSKVAAAGVLTLKRIVDVDNGDVIMGTLVDTVKQPWGTNKPFPNPTKIADNVNTNLINNAIVHAFSGFEHYLTNLISDIAHFSEKGNKKLFVHAHTDSAYNPNNPPEYSVCCLAYAEQFSKNNVLAIRINELCDKLDIENEDIKKLLPLFEYFRNLRNCIAHLDGTANKDLVESWNNPDLQNSVIFWNQLNRNTSPTLLVPIRGKKVNLSLANSIMASAICYKIAQCINTEACKLLGEKGFVHMAAFNSLMIEYHIFRDIKAAKTSEGIISNYLAKRYYVKKIKTDEVIEQLKTLNLRKDCITRYNMLK